MQILKDFHHAAMEHMTVLAIYSEREILMECSKSLKSFFSILITVREGSLSTLLVSIILSEWINDYLHVFGA